MALPKIQPNFSGGELSPDLWGHVDLARYAAAAATARNLFCNYRGGLFSRAGTAYVGRTKQKPPSPPPRDIRFQFSLSQSYVLEFGELYMRVKTQGAYVLESAITITGATQANPCQITAAHNYANGDWVYIIGVSGMTQLNGNTYIVANSNTGAGTFTLTDLDGIAINSTAYGAFTAGGTVARLYTLSTPYSAADLPYLKFSQSADVMSLTLVNLATGTEYPPYELKRLGATNWTITQLSVGSKMVPPTAVTATASDHPDHTLSPPTKPCAYAYVVTAIDLTSGDESIASDRKNIIDSVDMSVTAGSITVGWDRVEGAGKYNIYRTAPAYNTQPSSTTDALPVPAGALFFYAGSSFGNQFVDSNIETDATKVPPLHLNPFARGQVTQITVLDSNADWTSANVSISTSTGTGFVGEVVIVEKVVVAVIIQNPGEGYLDGDTAVFAGDGSGVNSTVTIGPQSGTYPAVSAYFQQRRVYAQSLNQPDTMWTSQTGLFTNFDSGDPPNDADAITASPFSQSVDGIQWLVPMPGGLVALTGSSAWQISGKGGTLSTEPITPSSEQATAQAFSGSHDHVPPIRINYEILYLEARGSWVRNLNYNLYFNIYFSGDLSWPSAHLFIGHQIEQWAWAEEPYKIIWAVREDGALLSLTYIKEQEVSGWARHDTQGMVRGVCCVTEPSPQNKLYLPPTDAVYWIVERYLGGQWLYVSERMNDRNWPTKEEAWCVDCGLSTLTSSAFPNATLYPSAAAGVGVTISASSGVFSGGDVGKILRLGGGIATITGFASASQITVTFTRPIVITVPGDPGNTPMPALPYTWSVLPQVTALSGLSHLAGKQVVGLADGVPFVPVLVPGNGIIPLPFTASLVTVGLSFLPQFQSLYLEPSSQPTVQGRRKALTAVTARLSASGLPYGAANEVDGSAADPPQLAPNWGDTQPLLASPPGAAPPTYQTAAGQAVSPLYTGDVRVLLRSDWRKEGQVALQQPNPVPMNLLAIIPEYQEGDLPEVTYQRREQQPRERQRAMPR